MCGRFIQCTSGEALAERFHLPIIPDLTPRYNVAPSQSVGVIRVTHAGHREFVALRWGLEPAWAPEPRTAYSTFNARAETVADKPTYRHAFRRRRCLIPADGFYRMASGRETQATVLHCTNRRRTVRLRRALGTLGAGRDRRGILYDRGHDRERHHRPSS
mgnify:CR=1 FL=1